MRTLLATTLLALCSSSFANEFTIRISEETLSLYLEPVVSEQNAMQLAFLHNDDEDSDLISFGYFASGGREDLYGRLGGKAYYADLDNDSGYGIALGGEMFFPIQSDLIINGGVYYGPSSLSFSDVDGYEEYFIRVNYQVLDNARVGAGYGSLDVEPEQGRDAEVEDGVFIEMNLTF